MTKHGGGKKTAGGRIMKWIGAITAIVSLVLGIRQVVIIVQENIARKQQAAALSAEAWQRTSVGDYSNAWKSITQAAELESEYNEAQADIAMDWLRNIHISPDHGERSFTEVTEKVLPVLYRAIDSTRKTYSAKVLAHIGWANYLMFRDGDRRSRVDEQFKNALHMDSTNLYAHAMYGFWILFPGHGKKSLEDANGHFAAALRGGKDTAYVRQLMVSAYRNASGPEFAAQAIRLANEMRRNHETLDLTERENILTDAYFMYRNEIMSEVGKHLLPKDHLETFLYLAKDIDSDAKPFLRETLIKLRKASSG